MGDTRKLHAQYKTELFCRLSFAMDTGKRRKLEKDTFGGRKTMVCRRFGYWNHLVIQFNYHRIDYNLCTSSHYDNRSICIFIPFVQKAKITKPIGLLLRVYGLSLFLVTTRTINERT